MASSVSRTRVGSVPFGSVRLQPDRFGGVRLQADSFGSIRLLPDRGGAVFATGQRMRTNYPRHLAGVSYVGFQRYSLTFCTNDRTAIFVEPDAVAGVEAQILRAAMEERFALVAYCFMPDHVHVVAEGTAEDSDLKKFVGRAKQYAGYYHKQSTGQRLWQRYGHEHVVRDDERLETIVRYVIENPVRAGMVSRVEDYPFIGSSLYTLRELMDFAYGRR